MHIKAVQPPAAVQSATDPSSAEVNVDALGILYYLDLLGQGVLNNPSDPNLMTQFESELAQLQSMVNNKQITDPNVLTLVTGALASIKNTPPQDTDILSLHAYWITPNGTETDPPAVLGLSYLSTLKYDPTQPSSDQGNTMFLTSMILCDVETLSSEKYFPSSELSAFFNQMDNSGNLGYVETALFLNTYASQTPGLSDILKKILPSTGDASYDKFYQIFESGQTVPNLQCEIDAFADLAKMLYQ
jgi:hypothetical protein